MKQVEETNKAFRVSDEEGKEKSSINNGGVSAADNSTKRNRLSWIPVLALLVAAGVLMLTL